MNSRCTKREMQLFGKKINVRGGKKERNLKLNRLDDRFTMEEKGDV